MNATIRRRTFVALILGTLIMPIQAWCGQPQILYPAGGEVFHPGSTQKIEWDTTVTSTSKRWHFMYATSKEGPWESLETLTNVKDSGKTRGTCNWRVPYSSTTTGYIRMVDVADESTFAVSKNAFAISQSTLVYVDSTLRGEINDNITLSSEKVYGLDGFVYVNGTLTIQPGTIIVGDTVGQNSVLCVNRGGKLIADGTPSRPIVFTSRAIPGQRSSGDWGGIVLCGRAPINQPGGQTQVEGGIADINPGKGWYGGDDVNDNSGILRYVRIEFAGIAVLPDNELNGLTLGGVGKGTTLEYIQVSYANDDAFEWFGGTVDAKHLIAYGTRDDDFDCDNGWNGRVQWGIVKRFQNIADQSTSEALEIDNDSKSSYNSPRTAPVFSNLTIIGPMQDTSWTPGNGPTNYNSRFGAAIQIRRAALASIYNSVIIGFPRGIEIAQVPTMIAASQDSLAVRANSWYGWKNSWMNVAGGTPPSGFDPSWIAQERFANTGDGSNPNNASLVNPWSTNSTFNPAPTSAAPYLTTALWDAGLPGHFTDEFFTKVDYRGALSDDEQERWDTGWTNYDPVNSNYVPVSVAGYQTATPQLHLSPNPCSDFATLVVPSCVGSCKVEVRDLLGNVLLQLAANGEEHHQRTVHLRTGMLPSGEYLVVVTDRQSVRTQLFNVVK